MARSAYVYVVMLSGQVPPLAAYTVKHEMAQGLRRIEHDSPSLLTQVRVYRMADGGGTIAEMAVDEIFNDGS